MDDKLINIYHRIFEEFVRDGEKSYIGATSFRDFVSSNRHFLGKEFKRIVPVSFEPFTVLSGYNVPISYDLQDKDMMFLDINGDILYTVDNGMAKYSERYYCFVDPDDAKTWTNVTIKALESYNNLSSDYIAPPNIWYVRSIDDPFRKTKK